MIIKILLLLFVATFWRLGGWDKAKWSGYRDFLIPIILGTYIGVIYWDILLGIFTIAAFNIIRIGYGAYDPINDDKPSLLARITHDRKGWINRGIAGFLYGFISLIPLCIYLISYEILTLSFLTAWGVYCLLNLFIGGLLCYLKVRDIYIEPAIGAGVATLLFLL